MSHDSSVRVTTRKQTRQVSLREVSFWRSPACPGVELRRASYRRQTFHRHTHPVYSLGLVLNGSTEFDYCGQHFRAQAGDLVLIAPGVVHDCNPQGDEPLGYWMFYLDAAVLGSPTADRAIPPPILADAGLWRRWQQLARQLVRICQLPPELEAAAAAAWRLELQHVWQQTWQRWPQSRLSAPAVMPLPWLQQVQSQLAAELAHPLALNELSVRVGISPSHLNRRFGAAMGLPPHRYHLQLRIDAAKRKLAAGESIVQVAIDLGFSDQSHFTRLFSRVVGATPAQYQKQR